jgi:CRP/FNR family transcriptional regulator
MNFATPLAFKPCPNEADEHEPAADLLACIVHRFGNTCSELKVRRNTVLCTQGEKLSCLYLVKQGEILLTRLSPDGREMLVSILGPGEFFGEGALLRRTPVTFSASATKVSVLLRLPDRKFKLMLEDPQVCRALLEAIAHRCDDAWTQMEVLGCTHVRDKVRSGLLWLSGRIGVETREGVRIDLNQTQLARMVGCSREAFCREVGELRRLRTVDVRPSNGRRSLFVVDPEGLS